MGKHHYVYQLEDAVTHIKYIGVRSSTVSPEHDTYMSSSKIVKRLLREGRQFTKMILSTWQTRREACAEEARLHILHDVGRNPAFYNLACSPHKARHGEVLKGRTYEDIHGPKKATRLRAVKSERLKGRVFSEEHKQKMRDNHADVNGANNPKAIGGSLYSKDDQLLCVFSCKKELVDWCREHHVPHKLLFRTGHYDPPLGRRNKNLTQYFGTYVVYTSK